jgi:CDP-glycerol glycerophosphotransferase
MVCSGLVTNTKYARNITYKSEFVVYGIYDKLRRTYVLTDGYVWRYLFKTEFVKKNKLMFNTKMISQEDVVFVLSAIAVANAVAFVPGVFYHYMFNDTSALNNRDTEHHKKMKAHYKQGKQFKRNFVRTHGVRRLWYLRKILRNF